ncbi:hypothetical protein HN51_065914 [Arachis hypogaea]
MKSGVDFALFDGVKLLVSASGPFVTRRYAFRLATTQTGGGYLFACNVGCSPFGKVPFSSLFMLEIVLIRHLIPWAGHNLFSSFLSFFDFEEDPTNVFYRHRLLTLIVRSTQPKSSGTLSALPFLVKEREFYKLMQLRESR